jgi:NAD(P)H-flavin reductase
MKFIYEMKIVRHTEVQTRLLTSVFLEPKVFNFRPGLYNSLKLDYVLHEKTR